MRSLDLWYTTTTCHCSELVCVRNQNKRDSPSIRRTKPSRVPQSTRLLESRWIFENAVIRAPGIMHEQIRLLMRRAKSARQVLESAVPLPHHAPLVLNRIPPVVFAKRQRRALDRRHAQKQQVPRASGIQVVEQLRIHVEDGVIQRSIVEPPRVPDVVDADEEGEEGVVWLPRGRRRVRAVRALEGGDLVFETEDCGRVGRDEGRFDGCAA
jgi:hypothetical protein